MNTNKWIEEFKEKFVTDGITYNMEDGSLNRDRTKIRIKDPEKAIEYLQDLISKVREEYRQQLKEKVEGKFNERRKKLGKLIEKWDYSEDNARMRELEILESDVLTLLGEE